MRGVTIRVGGSGSAGVLTTATGNPTIKIDQCAIIVPGATGTALSKTMGSTFRVGATKLDALSSATGPGQVTCVNVYNGSYFPLSTSCL